MVEIKRDSRRGNYKKGLDASEGRRRRDDTRLQLRKDKKVEGLAKRRAMGSALQTNNPDVTAGPGGTANGTTEKKTYTVSDIPTLVANLTAQDIDDSVVLESVRGFRRLLSIEKNPPVQEVLNSGALPILARVLTRADNTNLQFEAAWALTNIASTDYTHTLIDADGCASNLIALLQSPSADVREQAAWCLGNIAGDSPKLRDHVLELGAMAPLLLNLAQPANESLLGNCAWALSNFCRGKPQPSLSSLGNAIPCLASLLQNGSTSVKTDACWALSYLSDGDDERIQAVMDAGVTPTLVSLLTHESSTIVTPALRALGNFVSGNDKQTQAVINAGVLSKIGCLLVHKVKNIRKETAWLVSNIAAGTHDQIGTVLCMISEMSMIVDAVHTAEWEVRKEAVWVVSNIATGGTDDHIMALVDQGGIEAICSVLEVSDVKITMVALDAIDHILRVGDKHNRDYVTIVDECDGIDTIESLQEHENDDIYQKAVSIIETYFGSEDGEEDENLVPVANENTFSFGVPQKMLDEEFEDSEPAQAFNFGSPSPISFQPV